MPGQRPGRREVVTATKAVVHGKPAQEGLLVGIAAKSAQPPPMVPNAANALLAQTIAIGEDFVLFLDGTVDVLVADLPAGAVEEQGIYIQKSDNSLADAAEALTTGALEAAYMRFGVIVDIDTVSGRAKVNLNVKSEIPG